MSPKIESKFVETEEMTIRVEAFPRTGFWNRVLRRYHVKISVTKNTTFHGHKADGKIVTQFGRIAAQQPPYVYSGSYEHKLK